MMLPTGDALAKCLAESPCMQAGHSAADCLRPPLSEDLPEDCKALKYTYGACKRGLIDMRKRFRGPVPVGYRTANGEEPQMLYSGFDGRDVSESTRGPTFGDMAAVEALQRGELVGRDGTGLGTGDKAEDLGRRYGWREIQEAKRREG
jgi:cytochrome c oxidase assembly factor 5